MVNQKVEQMVLDVDNLILEICEKYEVTTLSAVAVISARLFAITKDEYPEHPAIGLLDKVVERLVTLIQSSHHIPKDSLQNVPNES
jgi:hypothetical protein